MFKYLGASAICWYRWIDGGMYGERGREGDKKSSRGRERERIIRIIGKGYSMPSKHRPFGDIRVYKCTEQNNIFRIKGNGRHLCYDLEPNRGQGNGNDWSKRHSQGRSWVGREEEIKCVQTQREKVFMEQWLHKSGWSEGGLFKRSTRQCDEGSKAQVLEWSSSEFKSLFHFRVLCSPEQWLSLAVPQIF